MQPSSQNTHGIFTLYRIDRWQGWDCQLESQPHARGKQEKQVLVINFPCVWTEEPLTGHRYGKQKALYPWGSSKFSPLKVRNIKSTYNKWGHPALISLWFGLNKVWLCEHLRSAGQLHRLTKDGAAMLLGSAGFRGVTQNWEQIPEGSPSCAVVQPNSANTPVNYHRRGCRVILLLAIFLITRIYLKIQTQNVLSRLASSENLPEMQIPASHLLLTESGIQRMGPIGYNTGGCPLGCPMLEFSACIYDYTPLLRNISVLSTSFQISVQGITL